MDDSANLPVLVEHEGVEELGQPFADEASRAGGVSGKVIGHDPNKAAADPEYLGTFKKPLTELQRQMVALHLNGHANTEIAYMLDCNPAYIGKVLRKPAVRELLSEIAELQKLELAALMVPAIDAIRRNLNSSNASAALKAADMVMQTQGAYGNKAERADTAEDVMARLLEVIKADGTQVRIIEQRGRAVIPNITQ